MSPKDTKRHRRAAPPGRARAALQEDGAWARPRSPLNGHGRLDDANAFMPDPEGGPARIDDDLAESLAEEFIQSATRGSDDDEAVEGIVPEELGGPFIETSAADEFANDTDDMNPPDADREPLPRPVAGLVQNPPDPDDIDDED
jgi:hypothetical protein